MLYPLKLAGRVDRAAQVHENDTLRTKAALKVLGHYKTPKYGMTPYPDEPMFAGIKAYQKANNLRIDGVMQPKGETEHSINKRIAEEQAAQRGRFGATKRRKERRDKSTPKSQTPKLCVEGQYSANKRICVPGTELCMDNWVCEPSPSGGGGRG